MQITLLTVGALAHLWVDSRAGHNLLQISIRLTNPKPYQVFFLFKRLEIVFVELQVIGVLFTCDWRFILRSVSQAWFGTGNALSVQFHGAS